MTNDDNNGNGSVNETGTTGGAVPHLTMGLEQRFRNKVKAPYQTPNFFVHLVEDTGGHRHVVYQSLPKLTRQSGLLQTIQANQTAARQAKDEYIHQKLEIVEPELEGAPFYLVESLEGESLGDLIEQEDLDQAGVVEIVASLLKALKSVHNAGLVYGCMDIDQIRVIKSNNGRYVKLGGLYRIHTPDNPVRLGFNPEFNAPNAPEGEPFWLPEDDIYVVGFIAYRMFVGRVAYQHSFQSALEASPENRIDAWQTIHDSKGQIDLPQDVKPDLATQYQDWCRTALMFDRDQRFENASDALDKLEEATKNYEEEQRLGNFRRSTGAFGGGGRDGELVSTKKDRVPRWAFYAGAVASVAASSLLLMFVFRGPSTEQMQVMDAQRAAVRAVIDQNLADFLKLQNTSPLAERFFQGIETFNKAQDSYPPSREDYDAVHAIYEQAGAQTEEALADYAALQKTVSEGAETVSDGLSRLRELLTDAAPQLIELEARKQLTDELRGNGQFVRASMALEPLAEDIDALVSDQQMRRDETLAALTASHSRRDELLQAGIDQLAGDNSLYVKFRSATGVIDAAEDLISQRKWTDGLSQLAMSQEQLEGVLEGMAALRGTVVELSETARAELDTGLALSVEAAPEAADFSARFEDALEQTAGYKLDAAQQTLTDLINGLSIYNSQRLMLRDTAKDVLTRAAEVAKNVGPLARPDENAPVTTAMLKLASAEKALAERRFADAETLGAGAEADLRAILKTLRQLQTDALKLQEELAAARKAPGLTAAEALSEGHRLRAQLAVVAEHDSRARANLENLRWAEAAADFQRALGETGKIMDGVQELKSRTATLLSDFSKNIKSLRDANGISDSRASDLRNTLGAIEKLSGQNKYDLALEGLEGVREDIAALQSQLPKNLETLERLGTQLAQSRDKLLPIALAFGEDTPVRRNAEQIRQDIAALRDGAAAMTVGAQIAATTTVIDAFGELDKAIETVRGDAEQNLARLDTAIADARGYLPEADGALQRAMASRAEGGRALDAFRYDVIVDQVQSVQRDLAAAIEEAKRNAADFNSLNRKMVEDISDTTREFGEWVLELDSYETVKSLARAAEKAEQIRDFKVAAAQARDGVAAVGIWIEAIAAVRTDMNAAAEASADARLRAEEASAVDTKSYQEALLALDLATAAREEGRFLPAQKNFRRSAAAFLASVSEQQDNAAEVGRIRALLTNNLEPARALMPDNDTLIAEVEQALTQSNDPIKDGSLTRRREFKTLEDRFVSRFNEVHAQSKRYTDNLAGLLSRYQALERAGGKASSKFEAIEQQLTTASGYSEQRRWIEALDAQSRADLALREIETAIKEGRVLACPGPDADTGTRLVPAETYKIRANSIVGRIAKHAVDYALESMPTPLTATVSNPYCISMRQVTVAEFNTFVDETGWSTEDRDLVMSSFKTSLPSDGDEVSYVSYDDAEAYAAWYREKTGKNYQLPTVKQTLAAAAFAMKSEPRIHEIVNGIGDEAREWTREICRGNSLVVTGVVGSGNNRRFAQCLERGERISNIGFRLVIVED
ncbi:SUMF1/EgtB/PvdO family nonheme iron enzyme [Roseibium sp.]|uniref:SUMF1/EgtB/PvdO family nonheme iron enzyme n=1 Tax=Roseibium sp. TaxID=1936156 RepID=UPI003BAFCED6